jgi:hypothetical protein
MKEIMTERLTAAQEMEIETFAILLEFSRGPDDLFPPDNSDSREPLPLPRPNLPALQVAIGEATLALAA